MKIRKLQTLNEAVAKISDTDQGVVGIVFADAIRETAAKKEKIEKAMAERNIEMPNEDRFAHKKIDSTKEMKKMKLAESLFTEWFDADEEKETFVQPNLILEEGQYQFDDETGNIIVNKAIFDDYMEGKKLNVKFVDEEGEDIFCYKMISENDDSITMEYVSEAIPGIDEEIADCQKYPVEKPEAKDSEFISADDKQPKDKVKAKDTGFVSAEDKQPEKAAMKESFTNYDKTIDRIKTIFAQKDWSKVKKDTEKSDAGKKQIKAYFNNNGLTAYANLLDKVTIYLTGDPNVIGYAKPDDNSITLNRELDIRSVADIVKHELDNLNKNGLKESKETNWDKLKKKYPQLDRNANNNNNQPTILSVDAVIDKVQNITDKDLLKKISDLIDREFAQDSVKDVEVKSDTTSQSQSTETNRKKLMKKFSNLNIKESFTNWDSPESRIERYETDLPELLATMHDSYMQGRLAAEDYAQALKVAYDALDSVPQIDEALEDSQRYPIEKPKAKDSQFISKEDKQPTIGDAKDSQFISAGDKDVEKAFGEKRLGESLDQPLNEEVVYKYKAERDPLGEIIQVELTEGEWGYREENGKQTATRLPSANYRDDKIGANWDKDDRYAITVLGSDAEQLQSAIDIATKYNKEYKIEKLSSPIKGDTVRLWIYVDEDKDFDNPYKGDSDIVDMKKAPKKVIYADEDVVGTVEENLTSEQKFPVESPIAEELEPLNEITIFAEGLANFEPVGLVAEETWAKINENNKIATLEFMLEDMYPNGISQSELNSLLENDSKWLLDMLNISGDESIEATGMLDGNLPANEIDDDFGFND